jgi:protein TonB
MFSRYLIVLGGMAGIYQQIQITLHYPATARRNGTQGEVFVKLTFDDQGKMIHREALEGPGDGLNEEAIRTLKLIDFEVLPALDLEITFKLG